MRSLSRSLVAMAALFAVTPYGNFHTDDFDNTPNHRPRNNGNKISATQADLLGKSHGNGKSKRAKRRNTGKEITT